ncbi:IS30 family transposase [Vagococcus sp.]|uniref:IS30 family transposase n=1 Tax=Vagococcus sp. TaxID=1933889 RepID=UPI000EE767A0|nr:IS30 family transposase [Vagococcus sp.]HCT95518.1 IS30 family transposase [Vagococcus sp.]
MTQVDDNTQPLKGKHLTYGEIQQIEAYKKVDFSNRKIARLLGRSPQTINNAIKAGTVTQKRQQKQNGKVYTYYDEVYLADAHYKAYINNRANCGRRPKWVETDKFIDWADQKMLKDKCSLDVVVQKAKDRFPESIVPSTSTLYNWIDSGIMRTKNIDLLEKVGRKPRTTKGESRRNVKVLGTSIEERPESVDNRQEFGHWEIDTVVGNIYADEPVLLTLVERKTRFEKIFKIEGQRAVDVDRTLKAFIQKLNGLEGQIFKSVTSDNGSEFANLSQLTTETDVYFCHPYASYERGTSENQHKIIRRFLPKHQSLKEVKDSQVRRIQQWMNDYPRRILDYKTPHQAFVHELSKLDLQIAA